MHKIETVRIEFFSEIQRMLKEIVFSSSDEQNEIEGKRFTK